MPITLNPAEPEVLVSTGILIIGKTVKVPENLIARLLPDHLGLLLTKDH